MLHMTNTKLQLEYAWVLTREPQPSQEVLDAIEEVIEEAGIPKEFPIKTEQSGCNY